MSDSQNGIRFVRQPNTKMVHTDLKLHRFYSTVRWVMVLEELEVIAHS